jgi:acyl carrier protein
METVIINQNQSEIVKRIQDFVFENTFSNTNQITPDTLLFKEGYFDSMGFVSLISFLEETFSIQTESDDLIEENFESITAISKYILKKKNSI